MTNREWLESLSDEELAGLLYDCDIDAPCEYCEYRYNADCVMDYDCMGTKKAWIRWLEAEHEEESK